MKHVLIIAGETEIAVRLSGIVAAPDVHADVAHTLRAGLEHVEHEQPDLILADFTLADGTAVEFCDKLRRQIPDYKGPVLCVASPRQAEHYAERSEGARVPQDWIRWPAREEEVRRRVREWLDRSFEFYAEDESDSASTDDARERAPSGSFTQTPFARVLHEIGAAGRAGYLDVSLGGEKVEIAIRDDMVRGLRVGAPVVERLRDAMPPHLDVSESTWRAVCDEPFTTPAGLIRRLGDVAAVSPADAWHAWSAVGEDALLSLFSWNWRKGRYAFRASKKEKSTDIPLALRISPLIFEGVRRHYSQDRLGMVFTKRNRLKRSLFGIPEKPDQLPASALRILKHCDNHRTAPEVLAVCGMQKQRFFQSLYAMWVTDVVRFGPVVKSAAARVDSLFEAPDDVFLHESSRK